MSRLDEIEARANAATPGPWYINDDGHVLYHEDGVSVVWITGNYDAEQGGIVNTEDAPFIAEAREDVPYLLAEVRRLKALAGES